MCFCLKAAFTAVQIQKYLFPLLSLAFGLKFTHMSLATRIPDCFFAFALSISRPSSSLPAHLRLLAGAPPPPLRRCGAAPPVPLCRARAATSSPLSVTDELHKGSSTFPSAVRAAFPTAGGLPHRGRGLDAVRPAPPAARPRRRGRPGVASLGGAGGLGAAWPAQRAGAAGVPLPASERERRLVREVRGRKK
ncbi:hypothetical protein C2845_PM15G21350 [Panicum miliaceum]|uniref:Uncharacterized protein n=1 Tax=Panicum miliaceum TaxID=4540 RepID=A0A3L6Q9U1_PANMI|nr:hypothetical protein C2845_PM15G21350 [Panicum miliaceum]